MWNFEENKQRIAIITEDGQEITYHKLNMMQKQFIAHIAPKSLILVLCGNHLESLVAYIGCILSDIPIMLEDNQISREQLENLIELFEPEFIYLSYQKINQQMDDLLKEHGYKLCVIIQNYCLYKGKDKLRTELHKELALLLSTSGTMGSPKHVRLTKDNLLSNTYSIIKALDVKESDRTITSMKMSYSFGLSILNTYLYQGAIIILTEKKMYSVGFWKLAEKYRITSFSGVPKTFELFHKMKINRYDLSSLKVITQAGGAMDGKLWDKMVDFANKRDIRFFVMYGQTEATARISVLPFSDMQRKKGSIGKAIGGELRIEKTDKTIVLQPNIEGELVYIGKNVGMGYAENRQDLKIGHVWQQCLHTGDYGYFDEEGYYYITGRKDHFFKLSGYRINLCELEAILKNKFCQNYRCIGVNDKIFIYSDTVEKRKELIIHYLADYIGINAFVFVFQEEIIEIKEKG